MAANTNTVTLSTNFNVDPYYDDFDETKNYHRVLYRPGLAVQGRELIQTQSILQNQIDRFAESIYVEGSIIKGCDYKIEPIPFVKVRDRSSNTSQVLVANFKNLEVRGATSNVLAVVLDTAEGAEASAPSTKTLFVKYIDTGVSNTAGNVAFSSSEVLNTVTGGYSANVITGASSTGFGSRITIGQGIVFAKDHFIRIPEQSIVLSKYSKSGSYFVGFDITESIVDYTTDSTLLDPASGSYNYTAPGANRLKLTATIAKYPITANTSANFVKVLEVRGGIPVKNEPKPNYSKIKEMVARYHSDTSGSFITEGLTIKVKEHLNQANNFGKYTAANGGNSTKLVIEMDPGRAYVKGYDIETVASIPVSISKGTDTDSLEQVSVSPNYGNYVTVHETAGVWDVNTHNVVSIRNQYSNTISSGTYSSASSPAGAQIGTARVRAIEHTSGTKGSASARYKLYLYDVDMTGGPFTSARSIFIDNSSNSQANAVADIIVSSGVASISETDFNRSIFPLPVSDVKTLRDTSNNVDTNFKFIKNFDVTISSSGQFSIATGSADERYTFSGLSGDTIATSNFHVVLNGTGISSGTVDTGSITSGANTITGLTNADTKFNVGDKILISSQTMTISSVSSTTVSTVENASGTYSTQAIKKKFYPGQVIDMAGVGGDGSDRTINATTTTSASFDIQETLTSTISATVVAELSKVDGQEIAKVYNSNRKVQITVNRSNGTANTTGPWDLGFSDVHKINSVRKLTGNTAFTANNQGTNVTSNFILDNGQTDNLYKHGKLKLAPNKTASAGDVYLVDLNYFTHDTSQGIGYFSVDSYPIDDANFANTSAITTQEIPIHISPVTGATYDLRNAIDIRPRITDTATNTQSASAATVNPSTSSAISTVASGLRYLAPNETLTADLDYYLSRRDIISLSPKGAVKVTAGQSGINPSYPAAPDDDLVLARLDIAPYPSLSTRVAQQYNRFDLACVMTPARTERYTMADIGKIRDRLDRVEYYTRLSFLENEAANLKFASAAGIDRFKNGAIVDNFSGHNIGNVLNPDYKVSIDSGTGTLRPPFNMTNVDILYNAANSTNVYIGPPDARITVGGTDVFTVGEKITAGAATGNVAYQVGRRVYLEGVQGTFAVSSSASGGSSGSSGTISGVTTPGYGKLASPKYAHKKVIEQKYASTTRNAAGLFWNFMAKVTLSPDHDVWVDTINAPDLLINYDNTNDNVAAMENSWTTEWSSWWNTGAHREVPGEIINVTPVVLSNSKINENGTKGRIGVIQEVGEQVFNTLSHQARMAIKNTLKPTTVTERLGPKVINSSSIPFMRSIVVRIEGRGFKPNSRLYGFFDGTDVNNYITPTNSSWTATGTEGSALTTDANGDMYCNFRIPNDDSIRFRTGSVRIRFSDNPTNATGSGLVTTSGEATFTAKGTSQTLQDTVVSTRKYEIVQETIYDHQTVTSSTRTGEYKGQVHVVKLTPTNVDGENYVKVTDLTGDPNYANYRNEWTKDGPKQLAGINEQTYWDWADQGFGDWQFACSDDPIAQTFNVGSFNQITSTSGVYLTKIDLFFATKDATRPVFIELREVDSTSATVTNRVVPFSRITLEADDINTSSDSSAATPVYFVSPVFLAADKDYAIVIKPAASNPNVSMFVSRLGGTDLITGDRINKQPYVGTLFASSNDKQWQAIQEEDLKFNVYVANFAINQNATAVFKNESRDFMIVDSGNTFNIAGEAVHGETTIVTHPTLSVNTGLVLVGNTSGANATVYSVSSNTIVLRDVSTAAKFQTGEKLNIVINGVKQGSNIGSNTTQIYLHSQTTPTGNVVYYDTVNYANTRLHLNNISGRFANNTQLKGQTSNTTIRLVELENIEIDLASLNSAMLKFEQSSVSTTARFAINSTTRDSQYRTINLNNDTPYKTAKYLLSKSLETGIANEKSGEIKYLMNTTNPGIGPVIDIEKSSLLLVNNSVNNDTTGETNASGGNALARYITRTMTLEDGQDAEDIRVRLSAYKPIDTGIYVYYKILNKDDSDLFNDRDWVLMDQTTVTTVYSSAENEYDYKTYNYEVPSANLSGSSNEIQYTNSQGVTYTGFKYMAIKIVLTSSNSGVVPKVNEMMAIALQA